MFSAARLKGPLIPDFRGLKGSNSIAIRSPDGPLATSPQLAWKPRAYMIVAG